MCPIKTSSPKSYSVFISNLSLDVKFERLQSYLDSRFGGALLSKSKNRGKNRFGHAIVALRSKPDYDAILAEPFVVDGCVCETSPYIDQAERQRIADGKIFKRVYINNVPEDITKPDLLSLFEQYGECEDLYLKESYDERFETKYCFATFHSLEDTLGCLTSSEEHFFRGSKLKFLSSTDFQTMLEIRRTQKKIQKLESRKIHMKNNVPQESGEFSPASKSVNKNSERKGTSDHSQEHPDPKTDALRAQETGELKIKYLVRPSSDRHSEYVFNRSQISQASHSPSNPDLS